MSDFITHPFHLVDESPWPLISSTSALFLTSGILMWFIKKYFFMLLFGVTTILFISTLWWCDISMEATIMGFHSHAVYIGICLGMVLFISSESSLFFTFFWTFFHVTLNPNVQLGMSWPPIGMLLMDPLSVPLLNTVILITSGLTITWSHNALLEKQMSQSMMSLATTMGLGIYFTFLQLMEYKESIFSMSDSVFGSVFFVITGFHGAHVLVGTSFLFVCWLRIYFNHFSTKHHLGFVLACWYWHFVDIIWLLLYAIIYLWNMW